MCHAWSRPRTVYVCLPYNKGMYLALQDAQKQTHNKGMYLALQVAQKQTHNKGMYLALQVAQKQTHNKDMYNPLPVSAVESTQNFQIHLLHYPACVFVCEFARFV